MTLRFQSAYITLARIVRTRGIRGEVIAEYHTDFPSRFDLLTEVWVELADGERSRLSLQDRWQHKGRLVLKFDGVDTVEDARRLIGGWVQVEEHEAMPLPNGTYYDHDLVGCRLHASNGDLLGTVKEILRIEGNNQLVVQGERGDFLVPAASGICEDVSIEGRRILVNLPDGLIDLNK